MKLHTFALLLSASLASGTTLPLQANDAVLITKQQQHNLGIQVAHPTLATQLPVFQAPAVVAIPPAQEHWVSSTQSGRMTRILVSPGDEVIQDQLLAELQSSSWVSVQRDYLRDLNHLKLAETRLSRDRSLFQEGIIPERRWLESQMRYHEHVTMAEETRQTLSMAGLSAHDIRQLARSRRLSNRIGITAPASGAVLERRVTPGQAIDTQALLFRIADLSQLWLEISLPQEQLQLLNIGDTVSVTASAASAHISQIGKHVNPANQTVQVRAVIDAGLSAVRPGQTVSVQLLRASGKNLFELPASALMHSAGSTYVFVQNADGFAVRPVVVASRQPQSVLIENSIQTSDAIAIHGIAALKASWLGMGGE